MLSSRYRSARDPDVQHDVRAHVVRALMMAQKR